MGWLTLVVAAWIAGRWPELRRETAAAAASPWLARAEAALAANHIEDARLALTAALARDPSSPLIGTLLRRITRMPRTIRLPWTAPPRLIVGISELSGGDVTVVCRAWTPPYIAMRLPAGSTEIVSSERPELVPAAVYENPSMETRHPETVTASPADDAYRLLATGDRRGAALNFRLALARDPADPRAATWRRQLELMTEHWSGDAYVYLRDSGAVPPGALAAPVLGGGQSGGQLAYTLDPLAKRPFAILGRASVANSDRDSAQASLGLRWRPVPQASLAIERLAGVGATARSAWNVRLAAGLASPDRAALDWSGYAEGGVIGAQRRDKYAAALGHVGIARPVSRALSGGFALGGWASVQKTDRTVGRAEIGPTLRLRWRRKAPIDLALDYRLRVAGNAKPGSGPALTVSTAF